MGLKNTIIANVIHVACYLVASSKCIFHYSNYNFTSNTKFWRAKQVTNRLISVSSAYVLGLVQKKKFNEPQAWKRVVFEFYLWNSWHWCVITWTWTYLSATKPCATWNQTFSRSISLMKYFNHNDFFLYPTNRRSCERLTEAQVDDQCRLVYANRGDSRGIIIIIITSSVGPTRGSINLLLLKKRRDLILLTPLTQLSSLFFFFSPVSSSLSLSLVSSYV